MDLRERALLDSDAGMKAADVARGRRVGLSNRMPRRLAVWRSSHREPPERQMRLFEEGRGLRTARSPY